MNTEQDILNRIEVSIAKVKMAHLEPKSVTLSFRIDAIVVGQINRQQDSIMLTLAYGKLFGLMCFVETLPDGVDYLIGVAP